MFKKFALASALAMASTSAHAADLVVNGGFENPVIGNSCCNTVGAPNSFPGWTVTAGDINVVTGTFASTPSGTNLAFAGSQYLDLIGESGSGAISQTFATVAGQTYNLTFAYSHNIFGGLAAAAGSYTVGSLSGIVTHSTGSTSNLDWQTFTGSFVAGAGSTSTLTFSNTLGDSNAGLLLDGVSVTAVPETATWMMMIGGIAVAGGVMRRRRQGALAAA